MTLERSQCSPEGDFPQLDPTSEHARFARMLALALLHDEAGADDVSQEAWLALLRRRRGAKDVRAWLRSVVRNLARRFSRSERRRRRRELAAACNEATPSTADFVAHEELLHLIIDAAVALREPYGTVVRLRFLEGMSPRRIAQRECLPIATVRSRLRRGLASLRSELHRRLGPDRRRWLAGLVALSRPTVRRTTGAGAAAGAAVATSVWMRSGAVTALLAGAIALTFVLVRQTSTSDPSSVAARAPMAQAIDPPARAEGGDAASAGGVARTPAEPGSRGAELPSKLAEVSGRLLLPNGAPAPGVVVRLEGTAYERHERKSEPMSWSDLSATSDADGAFTLRFDPPSPLKFRLVAKAPGHAEVTWNWSGIDAGEIKDLGDIQLRVGASVVGRLVDRAGRALPGSWTVCGHGVSTPLSFGSSPTEVKADVDPVTHEFRLDDLPVGLVQLTAWSSLSREVRGPSVELRPGEVREADILYMGADLGRMIRVALLVEPIHMFCDMVDEITLSGPAIGVRRQTRKSVRLDLGSIDDVVFEDVPPGQYTVEVRDARCATWRREDVEPGTSLVARLTGPSRLRLSVLDAASGVPIPAYRACTFVHAGRYGGATFDLWPGDHPPDDGLVDGLLAAEQTLIVRAPGYAEERVSLTGLSVGEERPATVRLARGVALSGVLLESDGVTPAAHTSVKLAPRLCGRETRGSFGVVDSPAHETLTDAEGAFAFADLRRASYTLTAGPRAGQIAQDLDLEDSDLDLELTLPPSSAFTGRLIAPGSQRFIDWHIGLLPPDRCPAKDTREDWLAEVPLERDGSFVFDRVRAGAAKVVLVLPNVMSVWDLQTMYGMFGSTIPLGEVVVEEGRPTQRDFDMTGKLPGSVKASVRINGEPPAGALIQAFTLGQSLTAAGILDEAGVARLTSIPPGPCYFQICNLDQTWFAAADLGTVIESGTETAVTISCELVSGLLLVTDATSGKPLPVQFLVVKAADLPDGGFYAHTNERGELPLRLAPGSYRLTPDPREGDGDRSRSSVSSRFTWSARGSPPVAVTLRPKKCDHGERQ